MEMDKVTYSKLTTIINGMKKNIEDVVYTKTRNYCRVSILPNYDNVVGGYNFQVFVTEVFRDRKAKLEKHEINGFSMVLKSIEGVKKVKLSPAYNQKMVTVFSVGLNPKLLK